MKHTPLLDIYECNIEELQSVLKRTGVEQFLLKEGINFSDLLDYSHSDLKELFGESYEIVKTNIYKLLKNKDLQRDFSDHINILYNILGEIDISEEGLEQFNSLKNSETMSEIFESIKKRTYNLTDGISEETKAMITYYEEHKERFRDKQKKAFLSYILYLVNGGHSGLIKLPTGTGKTFLFGHLIQSLKKVTLVLVPRINLISGTYDEFVGSDKKQGIGFKKEDTFTINTEIKTGSTTDQLQKILEQNNGELKGTLIMTYNSLIQIKKTDELLYDFLKKSVGFIVSDEAHRGLGKSRKEAIQEIKEREGEEQLEGIDLASEIEIEEDLETLKGVIHLHTTATTTLSNKSVDEDLVFSAKFIEVVNDGDLICPKQPKIGKAFIKEISENKSQNIGQYLEKYIGENGQPIYENLTNEYLSQKKMNGGYLPTVAFANNTKQVEEYILYLQSKGIKAIQCTTNKKGTHYKGISEAELMLENGTADIIVTCSKVGEGWDLPTLRGAIWLCPSSSPARIIQGIGRITRVLKQSDISRISKLTGISEEYISKSTSNTVLFSPNSWEILIETRYEDKFDDTNQAGDDDLEEKDENLDDISKTFNNDGKVCEYYTGLELLVQVGEIDYESAKGLGIDLENTNILTNQQVQEIMLNYGGRGVQESYEYFMNFQVGNKYNKGSIHGFKIKEKGIGTLKTISGIVIEGDIKTLSGFQAWINEVFKGQEIERQEKMTKESLLNILHRYKGTVQESYEYFMNLQTLNKYNKDSINGFKINGKGLRILKTISGIVVEGDINTQSGFQAWINEGFKGQKIERQEKLTKKSLLNLLHRYKGGVLKSYEYFMNLQVGNKDNKDSINGFKINGKGLRTLKTISGIVIEGDIKTLSGFQAWINEIFKGQKIEKQEKLTKKSLLKILHRYKGGVQESYEYFMNLQVGKKDNKDSIKGFKINGKGLRALRTISGIVIEGDIKTLSGFQEWINEVFKGQKIEKQKQEKLTKESLLKILHRYKGGVQESYDYFMNLQVGNKDNKDSINGFKINEKGIWTLRTISGIVIEGNIKTPSGFQAWINEVFKGQKIEFK